MKKLSLNEILEAPADVMWVYMGDILKTPFPIYFVEKTRAKYPEYFL